ncbi:MAG TPA: amidohydrolase family protein [Terriglobia bacterium]|nr:amidohydrolase family protein [Terriglobia bacterium]
MIVYEADWVCPVDTQPIRNAWLAVEGKRIVSLGTGALPGNAQHIAYPGCAILPGFVNAHAHLELTLFRGLLKDLPFAEWIAKLVRMKYQECTPDMLRASARLGAAEMLKAGITAVGEVMDVGTGWEAMLEFDLQGIAFQEVFGPAVSAADEAMAGLRAKVEGQRKQQTDTQRVGISPHAPYTVSPKLFEAARDYARRESLRMTTHIAESREETLFVRDGAGAFAESHQRRAIEVMARGCSPVVHLDRLGLLGPDMLLVHAIEAGGQDLERIRASGSFVVHCPKSNAYLGHAVAPVAAMRRLGIPVALGTDSVASNDALDMFGEMRAVVEQQKLGCEDVLRMATIEGARALGMERDFGSLEAGKRADFVVLRMDVARDPMENVVLRAAPSDIVGTFVGGKQTVVDIGGLLKEVDRFREQLRGR